jgi:hypothetical protein
MFQATSILFKELTYSGIGIKKLQSSLKHSFRINNENINWDSSKSGSNVVYISKDKLDTKFINDNQTDIIEYNEKFYKIDKDFIEQNKEEILNIFINTVQDDIELSKQNQSQNNNNCKIKNDFNRYFNRYLKSSIDKQNKEEELFWCYVLDLKEKEVLSDLKVDNYLDTHKDLKLKQFNAKRKKISEYIEYKKIEPKKVNNTYNENKIRFVEVVFKIPSKNEIELLAEESSEISLDFYNTYFQDYNVELVFEHNDEVQTTIIDKNNKLKSLDKEMGKHSHIIVNTLNNKTNEYDYTKQKYLQVYKYMKDTQNKSDTKIIELIGKGDRFQTKKQKENIGFYYQSMFYDFVNNHKIFIDKGINAKKYVNLSEDEQTRAKIKEQMKEDGNKKTSDRLFNNATLQADINKKLIEQNYKLKNEVDTLQNKDNELLQQYNTYQLELTQQNKKINMNNRNLSKSNNTLNNLNKEILKLNTYKSSNDKLIDKVINQSTTKGILSDSINKNKLTKNLKIVFSNMKFEAENESKTTKIIELENSIKNFTNESNIQEDKIIVLENDKIDILVQNQKNTTKLNTQIEVLKSNENDSNSYISKLEIYNKNLSDTIILNDRVDFEKLSKKDRVIESLNTDIDKKSDTILKLQNEIKVKDSKIKILESYKNKVIEFLENHNLTQKFKSFFNGVSNKAMFFKF